MKQPYVPQLLPLESVDWVRFITLIGQANAELARYDGILQGIINPRVLLSPLTTNEAVISSKIEGTQASLEEVLKYEASPDVKTEKYDDIREIINYREAMRFAIQWMKEKPITLNLIKQMHGMLLDSVRGKDRSRGSFRTSQNYIGRFGSTIEQASYVPPEPAILMEHLSNFEKYIHYDEKDRLVQLAIIHAQFEIIHPFLDGNGRLGRILIPLFLYEKKVLNSPMFYISEYLESNREEYYAKLRAISEDKKWDDWIEFFLRAIVAQAKANSVKAKAILELYEIKKHKLSELTHSQYVIKVLDTMFARPLFSTTDFIKISKIPKESAIRLLRLLKKEKILTTLREGKGRSPEILIFNKLFDIVQ
ncbi:MAG: Fic/DOC family N-terminal domain-containing protein [Candidatus Omnitrophota bacterium]|nr:Fic/DOC family N-terminal domain-containing protein [Candidatus Omnitrophota bacterium]